MYDKNDNEILAGGCLVIIFLTTIVSFGTFAIMKELGYKRSDSKCFFCGQKLEIEK